MNNPGDQTKRRIGELLAAVSDIAPTGHPARAGVGHTPDHAKLFAEYVRDLGEAKETADQWWESLIVMEEAQTHDRARAIDNVKERRPVGQVAHPEVIAVIRTYWLRCDALNGNLDEPSRVPPEDLVLGWLLADGHADLAELVSKLPYWPIGLEADGRWV